MGIKINEKTITYVVLAAAVLLLGFVFYGALAQRTGASPAAAGGGIPSECGDITSLSNVQHLSHHPDKYAACIKLVDPAIFKEAVGTDKAEFMQKNGIN